MKKQDIVSILAIIIFGVLFRLIPHLPNFTPLAAIALFGGVYLNKKYALIIPVIILFISDIFLGFHSVMLYVYGSFLLTGLIGLYLRKRKSFKNVFLAAISSSVLFFIITNFGVWLATGLYSKDLIGLANCYVMAIPFFRNTISGDLIYTGVFFGSYEFVLKFLIKPSFKKVE